VVNGECASLQACVGKKRPKAAPLDAAFGLSFAVGYPLPLERERVRVRV
jgi:hypothetical protein